MPVYQGEKSYYFVTRVNGKQIKKRGFKTKKAAQQALTELENSVNHGTFVEPNKLKLGQYMAEWLENRQYNLASQTVETMRGYLKTHISPSIGNVLLSDIKANTIARFVTELRKKGLADSTVKRIFSFVNASLNHAVKMELIFKNYASIIDKPSVKKKDVQVWNVEQVKTFLDAVRGHRLYIAFHLALATGMRQGEILGLRWKDVDFERCILSIRQTLSHNGKELKIGAKTSGSIRTITVDQDTILALKKHRRMILREKIALGADYKDKDLIVSTSLGTQITPRNLVKTYRRILDKTELPKITFHDLRHTHASLLLTKNIHPKVVSERLGHSKIQITLDTYSHLMPNMQSEAAEKIGDLLFAQKTQSN